MSALICPPYCLRRPAVSAAQENARIGGGRRRRREWLRKAFTLIELLIVVLILAVLMAVAMPLYMGAIGDSERRVCRANMQTIANAEQVYKLQGTTHQYTADLSAVYPNTGDRPSCPIVGPSAYTVELSSGSSVAGNGTTVPAGGLVIHCSDASHGSWAPGIDSD
jgi:type IV pilus assembly protein PilA